MHHYPILEILAAGFTLALIFGYLATRIGLSPIVGYLLAGFLVGPHTPGFIADATLAMELAEAGVILLMFGVGLHFHLDDLLAVKGISLPGAIFQSAAATLCGFVAAELCGLSVASGLLMGMGLAVASTVVLLRVLEDNNMVDTVHGHVAVGWLVVEDILTVLILVLLPSLAVILGVYPVTGSAVSTETGSGGSLAIIIALAKALINLALLWLVVLVVGGRVVPWLLNQIVKTRSRELFTLTVLTTAFATAVGAAYIFQASLALGAFLGGMVVAKSKLSYQAGADLIPLRDAFAVLFFLSVGMLLDPEFLINRPALILSALFIVLVVKPITAIFIVSLLGYSVRTGLVVGISLAQVGEFSFILAQLAHSLNIIEMDVYNVLVVCAIISITLNPGSFRMIPKIERFLLGKPRLWALLNRNAEKKADRAAAKKLTHPTKTLVPKESQVVVVGYGPTGKSVVNTLKKQGINSTVIDLNVDTVNYLNKSGQSAIYGDSSRKNILQAAGLEKVSYLVITTPHLESTAATATAGRAINGELRILVRARFLKDKDLLRSAGVNTIIFEEEEVAQTLAETVSEDIRFCKQDSCPLYYEEEE